MRRYPTLYLGVLFWPVMLPASYVLMGRAYSADEPAALRAFAERSGTLDVPGFIFVGFFMYMWLSMLLWGPGSALRLEQVRGSLEALFLTPVSRLVILFGPASAHLLPLALNVAVMGLALWLLFGFVPTPSAAVSALVLLALSVPAMYALASLFAAWVLRYGEVGPIVQVVRGTLVLLCGVTFPLALLPAWAQAAGVAFPTTHIVSAGRLVLLEDVPLAGVRGEILATVALGALLAALAVLVFRLTEASAKRTGALSRF